MDPTAGPERDQRIAELETRARSRRGVGVGAVTALVAMAGALVLIGMEWRDTVYFFSSSEPLTLGTEGEYHFERLTSNRLAQIHGIPTLRGAYSLDQGTTFVVVGLRDTPLLVRRAALGGEDWIPGRTPPQPDQRPFAIRGRLLRDDDASRYREGFDKVKEGGEVHPRDGHLWLLVEGERPRADRGVAWTLGLLGAFIALNAWFLKRNLTAR